MRTRLRVRAIPVPPVVSAPDRPPSLIPPASGIDGCIAVGQVMGAFGPRGDVRVQPFSDQPGRFQEIKRVFLGPDLLPARILGRGVRGFGVTLRLDTITTREHAKRLFGTLLYVPECEAVKLPPGEYFVHQLIGSTVVTDTGEDLGRISEILRTGSNDVYVVRGARGEVLIPSIPDVVQKVDLDGRTVTVTVMPGLLD
jgi:16S rRNA processing protein RimM